MRVEPVNIFAPQPKTLAASFGDTPKILLSFAGARRVRQESFDRVCGFNAALLLHFVNPIGNGLNDIARSISRRIFPGCGLGATRPVFLFDYTDGFLFRHFVN